MTSMQGPLEPAQEDGWLAAEASRLAMACKREVRERGAISLVRLSVHLRSRTTPAFFH